MAKKKKKEFNQHDRDIYRAGFLNGEGVTEAKYRRVAAQNAKLRTINRILVQEAKRLDTYDELIKEMARQELKFMPKPQKLSLLSND